MRWRRTDAFAVAAESTTAATPVPNHIGPYRVTGVLGEGGMGVDYEAVDDRLGRAVAVKVVRHSAVDNDIARERFWREARVAARVNHPHICQIYEVGEADRQLFMAMERIDGAARLNRGAREVSRPPASPRWSAPVIVEARLTVKPFG